MNDLQAHFPLKRPENRERLHKFVELAHAFIQQCEATGGWGKLHLEAKVSEGLVQVIYDQCSRTHK